VILRRRELRFRPRQIQRRLQIGHLRLEHGRVEPREDLASLDVITRFDVKRRHPSAIAFDADGRVVARPDGADDADGGGKGAAARLGHRHHGDPALVGDCALCRERLGEP